MTFLSDFWSGLSENSGAISVVVSCLMLLVWLFYLHMLLMQHRRHVSAKILINRSAGRSLDANCLISNMSAEALYIQAIIIEYQSDGAWKQCSLTDVSSLTGEPDDDARKSWFQGPVASGEFIKIGTFRRLLEICQDEGRVDVDALERFAILAVATYGPEWKPVGARRMFRYAPDTMGEGRWAAGEVMQLRNWRQRRKLTKYLSDGDF